MSRYPSAKPAVCPKRAPNGARKLGVRKVWLGPARLGNVDLTLN
ncbi:MAG: hypothetical protein ACRDM7_06000 [Thermoleophilaceae bacterium]